MFVTNIYLKGTSESWNKYALAKPKLFSICMSLVIEGDWKVGAKPTSMCLP